jgi:hypothetical protein
VQEDALLGLDVDFWQGILCEQDTSHQSDIIGCYYLSGKRQNDHVLRLLLYDAHLCIIDWTCLFTAAARIAYKVDLYMCHHETHRFSRCALTDN